MQTFKSIRGFNDQLPETVKKIQAVEKTITRLLNSRGYQEIRTPVIEYQELFKRSVGNDSDIVSKEMYTIERANDKLFTLRPEGTVGVARALLENGLVNTQQKLWYNGYMFRAENPQKGRYRQFQQIGIEVYGIADVNIEVEVINMINKLFADLQLSSAISLEINTIGNADDRASYAKALIEYMTPYYNQLDNEAIQKFERNPLRILDNKDEKIKAMVKDAPCITRYINEESTNKFNYLKECLDCLGIQYVVNPRLIRGLDYYNDTVFEWTSNLSESQGTVCAGGRYDGLVTQLGGKPTPAFGCAIGVERLFLLVEETALKLPENTATQLVIAVMDKKNYLYAMNLQNQILSDEFVKNGINPYTVSLINEQTSLKSQMKKADKFNADYVLIIGESERTENSVTIKNMKTGEQFKLPVEQLATIF
jgi:histidyl-tRNA synthetase